MFYGLIGHKFWEESDLDLFWIRVDSCWLTSELCWFVSDSCWLVWDSCWLVLDLCWFVLTSVELVLTRVGLVLSRTRLVLLRVDSCWLVLTCVGIRLLEIAWSKFLLILNFVLKKQRLWRHCSQKEKFIKRLLVFVTSQSGYFYALTRVEKI